MEVYGGIHFTDNVFPDDVQNTPTYPVTEEELSDFSRRDMVLSMY